MVNDVMIKKIAFNQMVELQIHKVSKELSSMRFADKDHHRRVTAWSRPEILRTMVYAGGLGSWLKKVRDKAKDWVSDKVLKAWESVRGKLEKFKKVFRNSKALAALTKTIGDVTPDNIKRVMKKGAASLKKVFSNIKAILMTKSGAPTLTDLIKRTVIGAKIADIYHTKIKPKAEVIDKFLEKYIPNLKRPLIAAIFIFVWISVDELSWEWSDLVQGFTGGISLPELITTFPESAIGFLTGRFFGIGFMIMPYMIAARLIWLTSRKYITWSDTRGYQVNPKMVDMALFKIADRDPKYREIKVQ